MAKRIYYPVFKAFTSTGAPAAGFKVYVYEAGTSTPLTSYSDNGVTANTNPVILNALGEAQIWVAESCKLTLKDTDDATVTGWPIDNIDPTTVTAEDVAWTPSGGFTSTNVQDALDEVVTDLSGKVDDTYSYALGIMPSGLTMEGLCVGFIASHGTDATNDIDFSIGATRDSTNTVTISSTAVITKQIDATWAAGDDAGGNLSHASGTAGELYLWVVMGDGVTGDADIGFYDTNDGTTLPQRVDTAGFSYYKVIGFRHLFTGPKWAKFIQNGDYLQSTIASENIIDAADAITTSFATVDHTGEVSADYIELIEYGVQDATVNNIYASDDGTNVSFFVGVTDGTTTDTDKDVWGRSAEMSAGLKPYLATREFIADVNASTLLLKGLKFKR